jgi:heat-inducible transcriptional repressor
MGLSLQWAALDDLLLHLARRLADLTGLLSLITRPQQNSPGLQALRLVPSGDRLLVFLVENAAVASSLNLRLPEDASGELGALERWAGNQLELGRLDWASLPPHLRLSGEVLRQGLTSHDRAKAGHRDGSVAMGLGGLLSQPEFQRSDSLRPLLQLVEEEPQTLLQSAQVTSPERQGVWIGSEHPDPALHHCAVVQAPYRTGSGGEGQVALVGPMRMAYSTARAAVSSVALALERLLR